MCHKLALGSQEYMPSFSSLPLRGYGAAAARLTPDQKAGIISFADAAVMQGFLLLVALLLPLPWQRDWSKVARPITSWNKPVSG